MDRMKTFFKYFLAFVVVYIIVDIGSYMSIKSTYLSKEYTVYVDSPKVEIIEMKSTVLNGYVKGTINNNTNLVITGKALKLDYYTKRGVLAGTKYVKVDNLLQGETIDFESKFNFDNVDNLKVSIVDSLDVDTSDWDFSIDDFSKDKVNWLVLFAALILIYG